MKTLVYINKKMKTSVFYFTLIAVVSGWLSSCSPKSSDLKCSMSNDPGMCMAAIPRYYYNPATHQCEQFTWGGCGEFPFETLEACETACE